MGKSALVSSLQMCPRMAVVKQEEEGCLAQKDASDLALAQGTGRTMPLAQEYKKEHRLWNKVWPAAAGPCTLTLGSGGHFSDTVKTSWEGWDASLIVKSTYLGAMHTALNVSLLPCFWHACVESQSQPIRSSCGVFYV